MAWQEVSYRLMGIASLIVHNGQLANPLNPYTKEMKKISGKRNKTDADFARMAELEFQGGLYWSNTDGPVLPQEMFDSMVLGAAKKFKEGPLAKSGVFTLNAPRLEYDGPRTRDGLWADERFRFVKGVRVGTARVMRTRPIFLATQRTKEDGGGFDPQWQCVVRFSVETGIINVARLDEWLDTAGQVIGLGDWRPQYGRFTAVRLNG